ncbi:MAG: hypothetical protein KatS3mg105_2153 [Gemmatales bacterium]|nr:MAG: hypothetical protein KatS3mg105_2153 [Gemmatales bacterium]
MSIFLTRKRWPRRIAFVVLAVSILAAKSFAVDPVVNQEFEITPEAGPWLVCVASYVGPTAPKLAHALVREIRERYGLPAYVFNRGAEERRKQEEEIARKKEQHRKWAESMGLKPDGPLRLRRVRIQDQCAVLVGGYRSMDEARRALDRIKKLDPPRSVDLDTAVVIGKGEKQPIGRYAKLNPFHTAFVVHNPTVPLKKPEAKLDYNVLKNLNTGETYSLLQCNQPWTLVVDEFLGETTVRSRHSPNFIEKIFNTNFGKTLDAGAKQAHEVAHVLRQHMQIPAYVLHTQRGSLVTVGAYSSPDDPQLLQYQKMLANFKLGPAIQFFAKPLPMPVPQP